MMLECRHFRVAWISLIDSGIRFPPTSPPACRGKHFPPRGGFWPQKTKRRVFRDFFIQPANPSRVKTTIENHKLTHQIAVILDGSRHSVTKIQ
jgi:hypothetical protein